MSQIPEQLKYSSEHEWVSLQGDVATLGITDFAQSQLGDVVYVEIDTLGKALEKDKVFGTVEAVKTVSDLFMPISGEITEVNAELASHPELVNTDPYGKGWMVKVKVSNPSEFEGLLSAAAYREIS